MKKSAFSIYNASAGSGKTYTLVKEYLKIILTSKKDDAYKNILAITFTNKAVHEMKTRIVESLFDFSKEKPLDKSIALMQDISGETGLSLNQIMLKSKSIIKNIIHNYAAFDISTIDKFTHKVIRSFAIDLDLPVNFEVSLDTENLLQEAVDAIVAQAGEDEELTKLLVDFTMEKTDDDKSWDISNDIFSTGRLILNENNRQEILALKEKSIPEFILLRNNLTSLSKRLEEETKEMANSILALMDQNGIDFKSFSAGHFPKHLQGIKEGKFNPANKIYREYEDVKINKSASDKSVIESLIPKLLKALDEIYKKFEKINFYQAFLKNITPLSLINKVSNELAKIQDEQNLLSISEFNKLINEQIQHQPAPFIYERLGERYKHFFIDEFQDTSEMQWQNLIPLIDNALSSEDLQGTQGSLLIVGDPKQSIYRWRGGKAEQFIELTKNNNPFSNKEKTIVHLESNYRSYDEVIQFNNDFFKHLSLKFTNDDYKDLYANKSFQKSTSKQGGFVRISFLPKVESEDLSEEITQDDLYLQQTIKTIEEVQEKGFSLGEVVLLVRNNSKGVLLANYLTENKIPVISSESLLLSSSSEVQLTLNLLRYLNDKKDKESLANALYYFSKNFETNYPTHDFIWKGLQFQEEKDLQNWLNSFGIMLNFKIIRKKSLYEIAETIILNGIPPIKNTAYTQFFLDVVLERDVKYQLSTRDFLEYWEKNGAKISIPSAENTDAIRIMTIHKSKGLEFPVVIFPFAEENFSRHKSDKMWLDSPDGDIAFDKFLIDKSSKVNGYGENAKIVYEQKTQEDLLDNINVLYVALTRAEEQLYVISSWKDCNKQGQLPNNLASYFIEYVEDRVDFDSNKLEYSFGRQERISKPKERVKNNEEIKPLTSMLNPESIKIAQREAMMWGTKQQEAIAFGNVMHKILSFVITKFDLDLAIAKAIEEGLIAHIQKETVQKTLSEIVLNEDLSEFFDGQSQVFNERNIIKKGAKTIIPDRVVINGKTAYLLDYKTGTHNQKYVQQLKDYEMALQEIGFEVKKKSLIYIGEQLEIVNL